MLWQGELINNVYKEIFSARIFRLASLELNKAVPVAIFNSLPTNA